MYTYDWTELEIHKKKCVKKQAFSWKKNVISHVFSKYRSILFENIYFFYPLDKYVLFFNFSGCVEDFFQ
jgi:hypothetical protein